MTWLYLPPEPSTPSLSAPASEASNSDCNSLTIIADRLSEASVTLKGKLLLPQAWSRRWKRGGYITRLSGLTLEPSTADRFADAWISSLRATRVRETASPESAAANSTTVGSLIAPSTSSIKAGLQPSSARTCRGTPTDSSPSQSRHWSDWAAALRSEYSARPKPAIRCGGSDCSSWPAAQARDYRTVTGREHLQRDNAMQNLNVAAFYWRSAQAADAHRGPKPQSDEVDQAGEHSLVTQVSKWPAPAARDYKGANSPGHLLVSTGSLHLDQLPNFVEHCFSLPPSSPDHPTIAAGSMSSTDGPNSNQPSAKRKLNPIFVEALMRWPTGLSGFVRPEMALIQWQQQQLSYVSMLCSPQEQAQMEMF